MENASKALLIAAAILIVIVLIGFGVSVLNSGREAIKKGEDVGGAISQAGRGEADKVVSVLGNIGSGSGGAASSRIIPEGVTYKQGSKTYKAGEEMPSEAKTGDKYEYLDGYGDYTYTLNDNGWSVKVKGSPYGYENVGEILSNINGKPVVDMTATFQMCRNLKNAPTIPSTVTNMERTFNGCIALTSAPEIPDSVTNMYYTFNGCTGLQTAPTKIPGSVTNMSHAFYNCTSLMYIPTIQNGVKDMSYAFCGCTQMQYNQSTGGLTKIPSTVNNMEYTFYNCTNFAGALYLTTMPDSYRKCLYKTQIKMIPGGLSSENKNALLATIR